MQELAEVFPMEPEGVSPLVQFEYFCGQVEQALPKL